jgi:hypothetical protein
MTGHALMIMTSDFKDALKLLNITRGITVLEDTAETYTYGNLVKDLIFVDHPALMSLMEADNRNSSFR